VIASRRAIPAWLARASRAALLFVTLGATAHAQQQPSRFTRFADFFRWKEPIPAALRGALDDYERGRFFAALGALDAVIAAGKPAYAMDDATFLRSLCLIGIGWDDDAVDPLRSVIEMDPPGPYFVPALLELVEIHDRAGRWSAVADAWDRYVDRPLASRGRSNERIARWLVEFGSLRPPLEGSTRREKSLFSRPKELAVILEKHRRERSTDRLLYRSGLALLRLGRHEDSRRALLLIGIESPYYPYAGYAIAQDLFAAGRVDDAARTLSRLERYPKITPEERALDGRVRVLHAAIALESGDVDEGIRVARSIAADDPEAVTARLLVATALLDAGKPSLAVVYDAEPRRPVIGDDARRALVIGSAYVSLGDRDAAARLLRGAAGRVHQARFTGAALDDAVDRLHAAAEASLHERRSHARADREHVSEAMRVVLAHDGPWGFATMLRRVRAALGAGKYRELALGTKPHGADAPPDGVRWLAYLTSPRRTAIERLLDRLVDIEAEPSDSSAESALRIANAYVAWLEHTSVDPSLQRTAAQRAVALADAARSGAVGDAPPEDATDAATLGTRLRALRGRLVRAADAANAASEIAGIERDRQDVVALLLQTIDGELRQVLQERDVELRGLELDLEVALSQTLTPEKPAPEQPR
jgi:tetratricopeptide (TPR) repeat protein